MQTKKSCIEISSEQNIVDARHSARNLAHELGFGKIDETRITTIVSELSKNIVKYATEGTIVLEAANKSNTLGIKINAIDQGPGISNIQQAMRDDFSTSGSLGVGLPSIKRLADEFMIYSEEGKGTEVYTTKWLKSGV